MKARRSVAGSSNSGSSRAGPSARGASSDALILCLVWLLIPQTFSAPAISPELIQQAQRMSPAEREALARQYGIPLGDGIVKLLRLRRKNHSATVVTSWWKAKSGSGGNVAGKHNWTRVWMGYHVLVSGFLWRTIRCTSRWFIVSAHLLGPRIAYRSPSSAKSAHNII